MDERGVMNRRLFILNRRAFIHQRSALISHPYLVSMLC
jgi:hypothetical protein